MAETAAHPPQAAPSPPEHAPPQNNAHQNPPADWLAIIDLLPIGVLRFAASGAIDMCNQTATQLLQPLLAGASLTNIFDMLDTKCPGLAVKIGDFAPLSGTIIDQHRIDVKTGRQHITLSLGITRIDRTSYIAVLRDITRLSAMLGFAFAASDLLLDIDEYHTIGWTSGALHPKVPWRQADLVGQPVTSMFAPPDRARLQRAMADAAGSRIAPIMLRLANEAQTQCVVAGLSMNRPRRLFLTIGRPPTQAQSPPDCTENAGEKHGDAKHAGEKNAGEKHGGEKHGGEKNGDAKIRHRTSFARDAEQRLRSDAPGALGVLAVESWQATVGALDAPDRTALSNEIGQLLTECAGGDAIVGDVGEGVFGVLCAPTTEMGGLNLALAELLGKYAPGQPPRISDATLPLAPDALSEAESVQALKLVLARFKSAAAQPNGLAAIVPQGGLAAVIDQARAQHRVIAATIDAAHFKLHFQPVVTLAGATLHHYEALLRLPPGADRRPSNTQDFVVTAEMLGLAVKLDKAVLTMGIAALQSGNDRIAVNISGLSIMEPDFAGWVIDAASRHDGARLLIELTETADIPDLKVASAAIGKIRAAGMQVCLDDFGAGNASFRYLKALPFDFVKIDGAYVRGGLQNAQAISFLTAMRDLAISAGAKTVAEMIETQDEANLLRGLGIDYGQGLLFGRPAPLPATRPGLKRWKY